MDERPVIRARVALRFKPIVREIAMRNSLNCPFPVCATCLSRRSTWRRRFLDECTDKVDGHALHRALQAVGESVDERASAPRPELLTTAS